MSDWPLIGVRFAVYLILAALFGLAAFSLYGLRPEERGAAIALRPWLGSTAGLGLLLSAAWIVLTAASMTGTPPWPIDPGTIGALLASPSIGIAWKLRMIMLVGAGVAACGAGAPGFRLGFVALCAGVALATLAWTGHGAVDEGAMGWVHLAADILHLIASGLWVGALLGLVLLVSRPAARINSAHLELTHRALQGFATIGTVIVGAIVVTGLANSWMLVGIENVRALGMTLYGRLLMIKLAAFVAMLGLASINRFRLTPALKQSIVPNDFGHALSALRVSLAVETACVVTVLGLVAWFGTLTPPVSAM